MYERIYYAGNNKDFYEIYIPEDTPDTIKRKTIYKQYGLTNSDNRTSAISIGSVCIVMLVVLISAIIISDVSIIIIHIRTMMKPNIKFAFAHFTARK